MRPTEAAVLQTCCSGLCTELCRQLLMLVLAHALPLATLFSIFMLLQGRWQAMHMHILHPKARYVSLRRLLQEW